MPCAFHRKGGPRARLSFFLLALSALPAAAEGDPFEDAFDVDYARQLLPGPDAPRPPVGVLPGFVAPAPFADSMGAGSGAGPETGSGAGLSLWQRDLIRRDAPFSFAHRRAAAAFDFALAPAPGLELRFAADRDRRELSMGDTAAAVDAGGDDWGWRAALAFPFTPLLVPAVVVGARSSAPQADALEALAFRGAMPFGLSWSLALGRRHRDYPVALKVPDYAPLDIPFLLRQDFLEAGLAWEGSYYHLSWSGKRVLSRRPDARPEGYSLDDSAATWRQEARAAYARAGYAAALDFSLGMGRHVFQGLDRKGRVLYPFSWQRGSQADYAVRADLGGPLGRGSWGGWLAAGESEYDALRPEVPYGHYFWDRNGVIDSYQGSLAGLFSDETWLLNGAVYAGHAGGGLWVRSRFAGIGYRLSAGYQYLILQANSHLTRRRTAFLLGYTETDEDRIYPTVEADLLPVGLGLRRDLGNLYVTMEGRAALPLRIRIARGGGEGGTGSGGGSGDRAEYGGGTVAGIRLGYRLP